MLLKVHLSVQCGISGRHDFANVVQKKKKSVSLFFPGNDLFTQLPLKGLRVRALPWRLCLSNHRENVYQVAVLNYLENEENDDVEKKTQFVISEDY